MMSLRARLMLFLLPAIFAALAFALGVSSLIQSEWQTLWHPEFLLGLTWFVSLIMIGWVASTILNNIATSLKYMTSLIHSTESGNKIQYDLEFSDADEVQELLIAVTEMQNDLIKSRSELKEKTRLAEMGRVTAQIVHDIQSPLFTIQGTADILKAHLDKGPKWLLGAHDLLRVSEERIRGLVDDLLTQYMGRPSSIKVFTAQKLLSDVQMELTHLAGPSIKWKIECQMASLYLRCSMSLLQRAISNIAKNAIEALKMQQKKDPNFKAKIILSAEPRENNKILICLHDNGPGIPEHLHKQVLQGGVTFDKMGGHGLGMQVVRNAMEISQGKLELESSLGTGTTFSITLPAYEEGKTDGGLIVVYPENYPIIVIDDDPSIRRYWEQLCEKNNIAIQTYHSWEALNKANPVLSPEQLAIVDYNLPKMHGGCIIDELQALGLKDFILMTADYAAPVVQYHAEKREVRLCPKPLPPIIFKSRKAKTKNLSQPKTQLRLVQIG